jgi:F-type H+-transporting ATPase subunit a
MAVDSLHISISAEKIFTLGGMDITNSMFTSLIVSFTLIAFAFIANRKIKDTSKPEGLQNFVEIIIEALHNLIHSVTGDLKKTRLFFPIISSFLIFILFNNWLGIFPGVGTIGVVKSHQVEVAQITDEVFALEEVEAPYTLKEEVIPIIRPGTADLNATLALAIISVFFTQVYGIKYLSLGYFSKFINFSNPIMFFVGILEIISEFAKIISFAFRLFGNIFAGEVLLVVMAFLAPLIIPMPFYGLEIFVGFIQALVFAMLSLVFFNMATHSHDEH